MTSSSQSKARVSLPAHWRQVSFICFDLGVMNFLGGIGAGHFYSLALSAVGFGRSSISLGVLFIFIGLVAYKARRVPSIVPIFIIIADILNTVLFLPNFEISGGVVLVKLSFLVPVILVLLSMLRVGLRLREPDEPLHLATMSSGKEAAALLSSMFVSVGAGMAALLLFVRYAMPALTESTNPFINIFHDLVLVPALLLLFPLGAAAGELIWARASRFYLTGVELDIFLRYLKQLPLISRLATKLTEMNDTDQPVIKATPLTSTVPRRSWRKPVLAASLLVILGSSVLVLVRGFLVPSVRGDAALNEAFTPAAGALVVSQTGKADYTTIKEAVAKASPGATIVVRTGVYEEAIVIDKDITLLGETPAQPTIECEQDGCLRITAAKATIKNFNVNAKVGLLFRLLRRKQRTAAVIVANGRSMIENFDVTSNNGVGIMVTGAGSAPEIRNARVHDCHLNGILFTKRSTGLVENSEGFKNKWAAIRADEGSSPIIRRSRLHHGYNDGILVDSATATVEECELFENKYNGIAVREVSSVSLRQSKFFNNVEDGVLIRRGSYGEVESCEIFDNKDSGIKVAYNSGSRIVNTKLYRQGIAGVVVWHNSHTEVEGATIFENQYGLWVESGGKPVVRKSVIRSNLYAGVEVRSGGDPLIEQTQIYGQQGVGIYFREDATGVINESAVFGSGLSNIVISKGSDPQIRKTRSSESRYAGLEVIDGGAGKIIECEIFNNYLGVEVTTNSTLTIENSKIKDNRHQGFVIDGTSESFVKGSTLTGNADGAWKIAEGARIQREGNTE